MAWFENLRRNPKNYNNFFHPNICHVCKWSCRDELKTCVDCHMISYCSEEHRMLHREEHEKMCEAIGEMSKMRNLWDSRGMISDQWLIFKKENVQAIQLILHRELKPYEEQMFLFAKSCGICRRQDNLTAICQKCYSVNTCADHELTHIKHDCHLLEISLWLDTYNLTYTFVKIPQSYLPNSINRSFLVGGMKLFIDFCRKREELEFTWSANDYNYSDYLSKPLTVLNIMNLMRFAFCANNTGNFVVHIIAGIFTDTCSMSAWEVFLHTLYEKTQLLIIMIGTESVYKYVPLWDVCDMCRSLNKKLCFEYRVMSYEKYMQSFFYIKPDLIIGFDADIRKLETNDIKALSSKKCPLALTVKSTNNAQDSITKIQEILDIKPVYFAENDFKSIRPYRDHVNDTFSPNKYLIIYNNIYLQNDSSQTDGSHQI